MNTPFCIFIILAAIAMIISNIFAFFSNKSGNRFGTVGIMLIASGTFTFIPAIIDNGLLVIPALTAFIAFICYTESVSNRSYWIAVVSYYFLLVYFLSIMHA